MLTWQLLAAVKEHHAAWSHTKRLAVSVRLHVSCRGDCETMYLVSPASKVPQMIDRLHAYTLLAQEYLLCRLSITLRLQRKPGSLLPQVWRGARVEKCVCLKCKSPRSESLFTDFQKPKPYPNCLHLRCEEMPLTSGRSLLLATESGFPLSRDSRVASSSKCS